MLIVAWGYFGWPVWEMGDLTPVFAITGKPYEYRIPDFRLISPNVIFDIKPAGTKLNGPQIDDFRNFSGSDDVRGIFYESY